MVGLGQGEEGRPTAAPPGHPSGSGDPLPVGQRPKWTLLPARATAAATLAWWPAMLTLPTLAAAAKAALPLWLITLVPPRFIVVRAGRSSICWSSNMVSPRIGSDMQCARKEDPRRRRLPPPLAPWTPIPAAVRSRRRPPSPPAERRATVGDTYLASAVPVLPVSGHCSAARPHGAGVAVIEVSTARRRDDPEEPRTWYSFRFRSASHSAARAAGDGAAPDTRGGAADGRPSSSPERLG